MKTSVIEVHDMLSVLSVDDVERRIGEVPGVESVTVNFAAASATVRYDETRLEIADIKSAVRQRGYEAAAPAAASAGDGHEGHTAPGAPPATPAPAAPKTASVALARRTRFPRAAQQTKPRRTPPSTCRQTSRRRAAAPGRRTTATPKPAPESDGQTRSPRRKKIRHTTARNRLVLPRKHMHLAPNPATSNGSTTSKQESIMTIANVSQGSACGLPQALRTAQEAIHLPEVQEMLRRLSEYKLGIFMPHMHDDKPVNSSRFPMKSCRWNPVWKCPSNQRTKSQTRQIAFSRGMALACRCSSTVAVCEMVSEEGRAMRTRPQT